MGDAAVLVTGILGWRRRNIALAVISAAGVALMRWTPIELLPEHHEATAAWWRQLAGMSYVWWALGVIVIAGLTVTSGVTSHDSTTPELAPVPAVT
jgi:alpha-1,2-mannosyltransferase